MKRSITRWALCKPAAMAQQSEAAIMYAFQDAQADIAALGALLARSRYSITELLHNPLQAQAERRAAQAVLRDIEAVLS